jgi:hypothetical protein
MRSTSSSTYKETPPAWPALRVNRRTPPADLHRAQRQIRRLAAFRRSIPVRLCDSFVVLT